MSTTIATKADLTDLRQEIQLVKLQLEKECALIRKDMEILSGRMDAMSNKITVRLGSATAALMGLLFLALKLTS